MLSTPSAGDVLHKPRDWMDVGEDGRREGHSKANSNFVRLKHRRGEKNREKDIFTETVTSENKSVKKNGALGKLKEFLGWRERVCLLKTDDLPWARGWRPAMLRLVAEWLMTE